MPGPGGPGGGGPGGRPGGGPGGGPGMGGMGGMGHGRMGPPPPPMRGWRRGGCCLPGCLMYVLGAGGLVALIIMGIGMLI